MTSKLDAAVHPHIEATLTPYEKATRRILAYILAGKLGSFDVADQAANAALEDEILIYEHAVQNAADTGIDQDLKNGFPAPAKPVLVEPAKTELAKPPAIPPVPAAK